MSVPFVRQPSAYERDGGEAQRVAERSRWARWAERGDAQLALFAIVLADHIGYACDDAPEQRVYRSQVCGWLGWPNDERHKRLVGVLWGRLHRMGALRLWHDRSDCPVGPEGYLSYQGTVSVLRFMRAPLPGDREPPKPAPMPKTGPKQFTVPGCRCPKCGGRASAVRMRCTEFGCGHEFTPAEAEKARRKREVRREAASRGIHVVQSDSGSGSDSAPASYSGDARASEMEPGKVPPWSPRPVALRASEASEATPTERSEGVAEAPQARGAPQAPAQPPRIEPITDPARLKVLREEHEARMAGIWEGISERARKRPLVEEPEGP